MAKKRIFSLILSVCLIVNALPFSALFSAQAANATVVNGAYDNKGEWKEGGTGVLSYNEDTLSLTKAAQPTEDPNEFLITLQVKNEIRKNMIIQPNATVLLFDVSNSMTSTKMAAAKAAALDFLSHYEGVAEKSGCYVAIVTFSDYGNTVMDWLDVSIAKNYATAVSKVKGISANGGSNMDAGLQQAKSLFASSTIKNVEKQYRFSVLLTDGQPTYAGLKGSRIGSGSSCSKEIVEKTTTSANALKKESSVFTIYFGPESDLDDYTYHDFERTIFYPYWKTVYGPTYGEFLTNVVATPSANNTTYAYDANDQSGLIKAYDTIFRSFKVSVTLGSDGNGATILDPMGEGVTVVSKPNNFVKIAGTSTYQWTLNSKNAVVKTEKNSTFYTYTLQYRIRIDAERESFDETKFYPANGRTYINVPGDKSYEFPVPGVKGQSPRYTVIFNKGDHGSIEGADYFGNVTINNVKWGTTVSSDLTVTPSSDYYFVGWTLNGQIVDPSTVKIKANTKFIALYAKKTEVTLVGSSKLVSYNSAEQSITDFDVVGLPKSAELTGVTYLAKGTNVDKYNGEFSGVATAKIMQGGKDVTEQYKIKTQPGALTIKKAELLITSGSDSKVYDGKILTCHSILTPDGLQGKDTVKSVTYTDPESADAGTYSNYVSNAVIENEKGESVYDNYDIKYIPGKLIIDPVPNVKVTITGNSLECAYDGDEHTVRDYVITVSQPDGTIEYPKTAVTYAGGETVVKGTNTGNYKKELLLKDFANTNPNYTVSFEVVKDITLLIKGNPNEIVIKAASASKDYDGKPLTNSKYTYTEGILNAHDRLDAVVEGTITDAGTVDNVVKSYKVIDTRNGNDVTANYTFAETHENGKLTVFKKTATLTSYPATKKYDGQPLTNSKVVQEGFVEGEGVTITSTKSITDVSSVENTFTYTFNEGTKADNYDIIEHYGMLTIEEFKGLKIYITGRTSTVTYDGQPHSVEEFDVSFSHDFYTEKDFKFNGTAKATGTDAGTYYMNLSKSDFVNLNENITDYEFIITDGYLKVDPVYNVGVKVTGHKDTKVYNGTDQSVSGYDLEITNDPSKGLFKTSYVTYSGTPVASGMVVGEYAMNLNSALFDSSNKNFANIQFTVYDGSLKINPITAQSITVSASTTSKTYDGSPLVADYDYDQKTLLAGNHDTLTATATGSITNVGTAVSSIYPNSVQIMHDDGKGVYTDVTNCYSFTTKNGLLTVNKRAVTITSEGAEKVYDGTNLTNDNVKIEGFVEGEGAIVTVTGKRKDAGTSQNTFTYVLKDNTLEGNYNIGKVYGDLIVTPITDKVTVTITGNNAEYVYDGNEKKVEGYNFATSNSLFTQSDLTFSGDASVKGTIADTYPMNLKAADFVNNSINFANVEFKIVDGYLTITKATAQNLSATPYTGTYDGKKHNAVSDVKVSGDVDGTTWTYTYVLPDGSTSAEIPQVKDAGTYTYKVIASNPNYNPIETTVTVVINPAVITVTADDQTKIIGDSAPELTYKVENPIDENASFTGGLSVDAKEERGNYPIEQGTLALTDGDGFKASNYVIDYKQGNYKVLLRDFSVETDVDKEVAIVGDILIYTIRVKNIGDVDLENLIVKSDLLGIEETIQLLKVGETWMRQYKYQVKQEDAGKELVNVVTVSDKTGQNVSVVTSNVTKIEVPVSPKMGEPFNPWFLTVPMLLAASYVFAFLNKKKDEEVW